MLGHTLTGIGALFNMMAAKEYTAQDWTAIFHPNHFPMPPTVKSMVETWQEDYEFCRHFLQGINPFLIKIVTDIAEVPEVGGIGFCLKSTPCSFLFDSTLFLFGRKCAN